MAKEEAIVFLKTVIGGSRLLLKSGNWALAWGDSSNSISPFNPQALNNQQVVVVVDPDKKNDTQIQLPPTSEQQSNFVQLWITISTAVKPGIRVSPSRGDLINGSKQFSIVGQYSSYLFVNLQPNNWTCVGVSNSPSN